MPIRRAQGVLKIKMQNILEKGLRNYIPDEDAFVRLNRLCILFDILEEEFGPSLRLDVSISPTSLHGELLIEFYDVLFENKVKDKFVELITNSDFIRFSNSGNDSLVIEVGVLDLWVKINE